MSSFDDTNEMKPFIKKAMSIPLLEEQREKALAKKWIKKKRRGSSSRADSISYTPSYSFCC